MEAQCPTCRHSEGAAWRLGREWVVGLRCTQGVPGGPDRRDCPLYEREPGTDAEPTAIRRD